MYGKRRCTRDYSKTSTRLGSPSSELSDDKFEKTLDNEVQCVPEIARAFIKVYCCRNKDLTKPQNGIYDCNELCELLPKIEASAAAVEAVLCNKALQLLVQPFGRFVKDFKRDYGPRIWQMRYNWDQPPLTIAEAKHYLKQHGYLQSDNGSESDPQSTTESESSSVESDATTNAATAAATAQPARDEVHGPRSGDALGLAFFTTLLTLALEEQSRMLRRIGMGLTSAHWELLVGTTWADFPSSRPGMIKAVDGILQKEMLAYLDDEAVQRPTHDAFISNGIFQGDVSKVVAAFQGQCPLTTALFLGLTRSEKLKRHRLDVGASDIMRRLLGCVAAYEQLVNIRTQGQSSTLFPTLTGLLLRLGGATKRVHALFASLKLSACFDTCKRGVRSLATSYLLNLKHWITSIQGIPLVITDNLNPLSWQKTPTSQAEFTRMTASMTVLVKELIAGDSRQKYAEDNNQR